MSSSDCMYWVEIHLRQSDLKSRYVTVEWIQCPVVFVYVLDWRFHLRQSDLKSRYVTVERIQRPIVSVCDVDPLTAERP